MAQRAHQAVAERCHKAKHAAKRDSPPEAPPEFAETGEAATATAAVYPGRGAVLTDAEWERVSPLLEAQRSRRSGVPGATSARYSPGCYG